MNTTSEKRNRRLASAARTRSPTRTADITLTSPDSSMTVSDPAKHALVSEVPLPVLTDGSTRAVGVGRPIFGEGAPGTLAVGVGRQIFGEGASGTRAVGDGRQIFGEGAPGAPGSPTDILGMPVFDDLAVGFEPLGDDIGSDVGVDKVVWVGTVEDNGEIIKESSQTPFSDTVVSVAAPVQVALEYLLKVVVDPEVKLWYRLD